MNLGESIYHQRTRKNLSQGDLAEALEVSRQSVSKWENNSAVPELEKLIKMSQIFGITIDELVTGEMKPETPVNAPTIREEPQVIYIEKPTRPAITSAQILGIILTACSLLTLVLFVCFGNRSEIENAFLLCLPVAVCGILCMTTRHPLLWSIWSFSTTWWIYTFVLHASWEDAYLFLFLGIALTAAALFYTVYLHRKGTIHVPTWLWVFISIMLVIGAFLLTVNLFSFTAFVTEDTVTVTPVDPHKNTTAAR